MLEAVRKLLGELEYSEIFIEEGDPSNDSGLNHDIYVNNQTYEVYKKINNVWELKGRTGDVNVNPDWDETDTDKKSYILNKPDVATKDLVQSLEDSLNTEITDLESLIKSMGVMGFNYDEQEQTVSIVRPNNTIDDGMTLPVCDGLKPGFIDVDSFLQIQQNKQDIQDEVAARVSNDVKSTSFDPLTNTLQLIRSDETVLEQILPKLIPGYGIDISPDQDDNLIIGIGDFELFVPVVSLDSVDEPKEHKIYLVSSGSDENNLYEEYIWVEDSWEHIGNLTVDLSNYYNQGETDSLLQGKVQKTSDSDKVYGTDDEGNQKLYDIDDFNTDVDLSGYYTKSESDGLLEDKANISDLSSVATSGSYTDLSNKPVIPTVNPNVGTCTTAAATAAKVGTLAGFGLSTGAHVFVRFTNANTAANPTLDVNSTGAKAIQYNGKAIITGMISANKLCEFVYNGTVWELMNPDAATATTQANATTISNANPGVPIYYPE